MWNNLQFVRHDILLLILSKLRFPLLKTYIIATSSISNTNVEYAGMGPLAREP